MKFISQGAQYAISAVIALSKRSNGDIVSASELARSLECPATYLSQLLSKLKPAGILKSQRGLNGGVYLSRPLNEISVFEVIKIIDGDSFLALVLWVSKVVDVWNPALFMVFWSEERDKIKDWLTQTTFADVDSNMTQTWFDNKLSFTSGVTQQ